MPIDHFNMEFIGPQTKPYQELDKIGALMDFKTWPESGSEKWPPNADYPSGVRVYDPYNPVARDIYWKYLNKGIFSLGMDGWWLDSSEPDHLQSKPSDFDNKTYLGSFRKVRRQCLPPDDSGRYFATPTLRIFRQACVYPYPFCICRPTALWSQYLVG